VEAFLEIHSVWKRHGYPFDSLVPSYATAIGSSADRRRLCRIGRDHLNYGVKYPVARIDELQFAAGTPYETLLRRKEFEGQKVLSSEIASVVRSALIDVSERGTAQQIRGVFIRSDGTPIAVGGKTGQAITGTTSMVEVGSSRIPRNKPRRGIVFFIGDRFFGTITTYVPGRWPQAMILRVLCRLKS